MYFVLLLLQWLLNVIHIVSIIFQILPVVLKAVLIVNSNVTSLTLESNKELMFL